MQSFDERYYTPLEGMPPYLLEGQGWIENSNVSLFYKHNAVFSDTHASTGQFLSVHTASMPLVVFVS